MAISENGAQQNHCDDEEMVSLKLKESQLAAQDLEVWLSIIITNLYHE